MITGILFFLVHSLLLVTPTLGESCTQEVEELKDALVQVRGEIDVLKDKMNIKEEEVIVEIVKRIKDDLDVEKESLGSKIEELMAKIEVLQADNLALKMKLMKREDDFANLETSVAEVRKTRGLPYVMTCAYQNHWETSSATITYDYLLSDYKNSDDVNGGDGIMDVKTGVYTVIKPAGYYTITFSGRAELQPGEALIMDLYHNGTKVPESQWVSSEYHGTTAFDQGSRTVILHLNPEDTLEIRTDSNNFYCLYEFVYCITLAGWEYTPPY